MNIATKSLIVAATVIAFFSVSPQHAEAQKIGGFAGQLVEKVDNGLKDFDKGRRDLFTNNPTRFRGYTPVVSQWKTGNDYQRFVESQLRNGKQIYRVQISTNGRSVRYLATFGNRNGQPWVARHGLSNEQMRQENQKWVNRGFKLRSHASTVANGQRYHIAVWAK